MKLHTSLSYALLTTLTSLVACDDPDGVDDLDALKDVQPRCLGPGCSDPPATNSNIIGGPLDNFPQAFNVSVANPEGSVRVESATIWHAGALRNVHHWAVTKAGQLNVFYWNDGFVKVHGDEVAGTTFEVEYTPDGDAPVSGELKVLAATCTGGKFASMIFCTYTLGSSIAPPSPDYPVISSNPGSIPWYATCPDANDNGALDSAVKFDAVFNHNVALDRAAPDIAVNGDVDMIACLNAVVAKPPYYLNVFYDYLLEPHPRALDASQVMAIVYAFAAWWDGASRTSPGHDVCFDDPIGGLFDGAECPGTYVFEGAYNNLVGQVCREGSGSHRQMVPPSAEYLALPTCTPADYVNAAGSPTIAVWSVPATLTP